MRFVVQVRKKETVLTDPQRRVYDGVPFSSEERWTEWSNVCSYSTLEIAEGAANCFKEINPGREYRIVTGVVPKPTRKEKQ